MRLLPKCSEFLLAGLVTSIISTGPAVAGQAEIDLLSSYTGNWKGTGLMTGGEEPETFACRMTIAKGTQSKINYAGRCSLVSINLSVAGTIAYNDDAARYEASMTSSAAFSGTAIGKRHDDEIVFDLKERGTSEKGGEVAIGSQIRLSQGKVTVDFDVTFADSGTTLTTSVPFERSRS